MGPRMGVESDEAECIDSYPHVVAEIVRLRKPVVVALHGAVYGAAMEIALACDLRVGDRTTVYGPVYAEHAFAVRDVAATDVRRRARGAASPAARRPGRGGQALQLGLLDELTEPGEALAAATELARRLAHGPTRAYGLIKSALLEGVGRGLLENLHAEENISYVSLSAEDALEGRRAFAEKRAPIYRGT